ncbi:ABC transporter ATP-binding protein [Nodosilinea sp. LEGE 07088]|uniref:dipeptide ABC transporter ATP-binding protein n=1 Tax=Nodosilinea sp. LEGE 07088 TaxID=2777968 RepID=UPI0018829332|nr:ABC transporter ATP-binding protein [Nodosilinea sp. LEGE 07088]MBE9138094.1 ABC transporter ATP-binding protein [Nodosilinea sp. LEGE 07088]
MADALFTLESFTVAYADQAQRAVDRVSLSISPGEKLGLVGESGCGKSTLGRAALRLLPKSTDLQGRVWFNGESVLDFSPRRLRQFRGEAVALVFQDPMTRLNPLMTIGDHCVETLRAHRPEISARAAKAQAIAVLAKVNIPASRFGQYPHEFSGGMRQRVAIALAMILEPQLIVADEPTTSLDVTVSAQILDELTRLCDQLGTALILISHDLSLVAEYCDRVAVMYQGRVVEAGAATTVLQNPQDDYTRSLVQSALQLQQAEGLLYTATPTEPLLRLRDVEQHYTLESNPLARLFGGQASKVIKAVDGVSLEIFPGEVVGLVGESGCGKSTLSRTLLQLVKPTAGQVEFDGIDLTTLPREALRQQRRQLQMVFQDPLACLNPMMTVGKSIADPLLIHRLATVAEAEQQAHDMLARVSLIPTADYFHRFPGDLSGGQQQRVAIARALITKPKLVICDEPVSMLDATVQTQVLELMVALKQEFDLTYLFITHDLWVARFMCDRIAVMQAGKIVELAPTQTLFESPQHPYTQTLLQSAPVLARASTKSQT